MIEITCSTFFNGFKLLLTFVIGYYSALHIVYAVWFRFTFTWGKQMNVLQQCTCKPQPYGGFFGMSNLSLSFQIDLCKKKKCLVRHSHFLVNLFHFCTDILCLGLHNFVICFVQYPSYPPHLWSTMWRLPNAFLECICTWIWMNNWAMCTILTHGM